jgi:hypothetical protein
MTSAGLNFPAPDPQRSSVDPDTRDLAAGKPVYLILRRVVSRWSTAAKVVAAHDNAADALADLVTFRTYEPNFTFAIFVPLMESSVPFDLPEPGGNA